MAVDVFDREYTREELVAQADELAQNSSLRTSGREAWRQVQEGALEGTMFASRLAQLYFLIDDTEPTLCAAE